MNERMDPRIDKLMAYLYGELPESERRAFERLLGEDAELRQEYEELAGTRAMLPAWRIEERVPSFVLVEDRPEPKRASFWERFVASWKVPSPAWGLAFATIALVVAAAAGLRVQKIDGGLAFRFGEEAAAPVRSTVPELGPGQELALRENPDRSVLVPATADWVTREEMDNQNAELVMALTKALNDYGQRRDAETYGLVQSMAQQLRDEQNRDYRQITGRLDTMGLEVRAARNGISLEDLLHNGAELNPERPLEGKE